MENKKLGKISIVLLTLNFLLGGIAYWLEGSSFHFRINLSNFCIKILGGCPQIISQLIDSIRDFGGILFLLNLVASIFVLIYISVKMLKMETGINYKFFTNRRLAGFFIFLIILLVVSIIGLLFMGKCFLVYEGVDQQKQNISFNYCSLAQIDYIMSLFSVILSILLGYWMSVRLIN